MRVRARRNARPVRLAMRLATHRLKTALLIALASMLAVGAVAFFSSYDASSLNALRDGVVAERGYANGLAVQAGTRNLQDVDAADGYTAVTIRSGEVSTATSLADAEITAIGDDAPPVGALIEGRRAQGPNEVMLSLSLAQALSVKVGDVVDLSGDAPLGRQELVVVGISVDPAARQSAQVFIVRPGIDPAQVNYWVTRGLEPDSPGAADVIASNTESAVDQVLAAPPAEVAALRYLAPGLGILLLFVVGGVLGPQIRVARSDVHSLCAAGFSAYDSWRVVRLSAALALFVGGLLGAMSGWFLIWLSAEVMASRLDQYWLTIETPIPPVGVMIAVCVMPALTPKAVFEVPGRLGARAPSLGTNRAVAIVSGVVLLGGLLLIGTSVAAAQSDQVPIGSPALLGLLGLLLTMSSVGILGGSLSTVGLRPASRALVRHLQTQMLLATVACAALASIASGYAAWQTRDTNLVIALNSTDGSAAPIYFLDLDADVASDVIDRYEEAGGTSVISSEQVDESEVVVRVTSPAFANCAARRGLLDGGCDKAVDVVLAAPLLNSSLASDEVLAAPEVLERGVAALITIEPTSGEVVGQREVRAEVDPNLPGQTGTGLLMSPENPVARELDLSPSGFVELTLPDFGNLDPRAAAEIRSVARRLAPGAIANTDNLDDFRQRSNGVSNLIALVGGGLILLMSATGSAAVLNSNRRDRTLLGQLGATTRFRLGISARVLLPTLIVVVTGFLMIPWLSGQLVSSASGLGWVWVIPLVTLLSVGSIGLMALTRVPSEVPQD